MKESIWISLQSKNKPEYPVARKEFKDWIERQLSKYFLDDFKRNYIIKDEAQ